MAELLEEVERIKKRMISYLEEKASSLPHEMEIYEKDFKIFYLKPNRKIGIKDSIGQRPLFEMDISEFGSAYGIEALEKAIRKLERIKV